MNRAMISVSVAVGVIVGSVAFAQTNKVTPKKTAGGKMTETQKQVEILMATTNSSFLTIGNKAKEELCVQVAREIVGAKATLQVLINYAFSEPADKSLSKAGVVLPTGWKQVEFEQGAFVKYEATGSDAKTIAALVDAVFGKLFKVQPDTFDIEKM